MNNISIIISILSTRSRWQLWQVVKKTLHTASVIKCFFLKNTIAEPKKHEKHEQKSPKTREKHEFLAKISKNLTPLTFFIAFLCINIFQNSKIGNIFKKKFKYIFKKNFWQRNVIFEKLKSFEKVFELKIRFFWTKMPNIWAKIVEFCKFFWNSLKTRDFRGFVL